MPKVNKTTAKKVTVARSAATGCFVSSASAAYQYYANNETARQKAVERFETRIAPSSTKPKKAAGKKARRSA